MTVAYKDTDKATDHLLNFIAGGVPTNPMGESAGNYNAVFGKINASDPLDKKTFSQIYAMQTALLKQNGISTATGRYQGLKATIQEYQRRKGIKDSDLFTQMVQDDFGLTKMVDRGYSAWWKKQISDDEFMYRLSCEWASLPDPKNGGKSHYDDDNINRASTSLANFRACLNEASAFIDGVQPTPEPAPPPPSNLLSADEGVRRIQEVLVNTGDLPGPEWVDGIWGKKSRIALHDLVSRDV